MRRRSAFARLNHASSLSLARVHGFRHTVRRYGAGTRYGVSGLCKTLSHTNLRRHDFGHWWIDLYHESAPAENAARRPYRDDHDEPAQIEGTTIVGPALMLGDTLVFNRAQRMDCSRALVWRGHPGAILVHILSWTRREKLTMSAVRSRRIVATSCAAAVASVILVAAPAAGKPPQTIPDAAMTVPAPIGDSAAGAAVASGRNRSRVY